MHTGVNETTIKLRCFRGARLRACARKSRRRAATGHRTDRRAGELERRRVAMGGGMVPGSSGAWKLNANQTWPFGHWADPGIATAIQCLVGGGTLLDVGAGVGEYGAFFLGCKPERRPRWLGIDGSPNVTMLAATGPGRPLVREVNFCKPPPADLEVHDWTMSLEVGEHIPRHCLSNFVGILVNYSRLGVVLSWARPGQPGRGHVSPRSGADVETMMKARGFDKDDNITEAFFKLGRLHYLQMNTKVYTPTAHARRSETDCTAMNMSNIHGGDARIIRKRCLQAQPYACLFGDMEARLKAATANGSTPYGEMCSFVSHCKCPAVLLQSTMPLTRSCAR